MGQANRKIHQGESPYRSRRKAETAGALNAYIYLIMDAQLKIKDGAYVSAVYQIIKMFMKRTAYFIIHKLQLE